MTDRTWRYVNDNVNRIEAIRAANEKLLKNYKGVLGSLTHDEHRAIAQMGEPAVMCGKLPNDR